MARWSPMASDRDAPDAAQRNAYDEGLEVAARIAYQASRGIGGGA